MELGCKVKKVINCGCKVKVNKGVNKWEIKIKIDASKLLFFLWKVLHLEVSSIIIKFRTKDLPFLSMTCVIELKLFLGYNKRVVNNFGANYWGDFDTILI